MIRAAWPVADERLIDPKVEKEMGDIQEVIRGIRNIRGTAQIHHSLRLDVYIHTDEDETAQAVMKHVELISDIACCDLKEIGTAVDKPAQSATEVLSDLRVHIPLAGVIDIEKEIVRHEKKMEKLQKRIEMARKKLDNPNFTGRAPADVVQREREALEEIEASKDEVLRQIKSLRGE